ncbi:MAG TPA: M48 family metallopeptidase [Vicinamibacteria bacterium]|jgi:Zn-dependent protease with chaperone function
MRDNTHLAWRAALAIALMIAFYVLALAVVAVLIAIPVGLFQTHAWGFFAKIGFFCAVGIFVILKSIVPRPDRFEAPGPRLTPQEQPRLFAEIRAVAAAVKQVVPAEVYLVPDVNAWVRHRGGLMGIGSRRVMGLGLPLLQVLTVPELKAVLAHEFGHFHGGDVAIGPWIYKTRDALVRTVSELHDHSEALSLPFIWYGNHFFRITLAVSRHQETLADRLAAGVVGARTLASGLRATNEAGFAFFPYWKGAVEPVLAAGFVPPLTAGFDDFLKAPWLAEAMTSALAEQAKAPHDPYDSHPPLAERLKVLGVDQEAAAERQAGPRAHSLLSGIPALEKALATFLRHGPATPDNPMSLNLGIDPRDLAPLPWEDVAARVWLPEWERTARRFARHLAGVTPVALPELDWLAVGRRLSAGHDDAEPLEVVDYAVGIALAIVLYRAGFTMESHPASMRDMQGLGQHVKTFGIREHLAKGPEPVAAWRELCAQAGIADVDLGDAVRTPQTRHKEGRP